MRVNFRRTVSGNRAVTGFVVGVIATMTIAGGGVAIASIPSSSTAKFTGCVAKTGGALRVIDAQAGKKCKSTEKTISWSKGWTHRGAWASGTAYKPGDVVTQNGSSYVARVKSTGSSPAGSATAWGLLAAAGATGPAGATGATGATGCHRGDRRHGPSGPVTCNTSPVRRHRAERDHGHQLQRRLPSWPCMRSRGCVDLGTSSLVAIQERAPTTHDALPRLRLRRHRRGRLGGVHQQHERLIP